MNNKCIFIDSRGAVCISDAEKGSLVCSTHYMNKCAICGKQATYSCGDNSHVVRCETNLCDDLRCELLHAYICHHNFKYISSLENQLNVEPAGILIGRMHQKFGLNRELLKAGFVVPSKKGGYIWPIICADISYERLIERLNKKIGETNKRKIIHVDGVYKSLIPPGVIEKII